MKNKPHNDVIFDSRLIRERPEFVVLDTLNSFINSLTDASGLASTAFRNSSLSRIVSGLSHSSFFELFKPSLYSRMRDKIFSESFINFLSCFCGISIAFEFV
uniref:Uncharacterized protein n=1 Tax=Strongyloides venezuelensis TaxID=75913 RepID=A0A0K0F594_STRVS